MQRAGAQAARRRVIVGLVVALLAAASLTLAVATGGSAVAGFDESLTRFTRGWADPLGWPVDLAHVIGLVTAPFWSSLLAFVLVVVLAVARYRAAALFLAMSALVGVAVTEAVKMTMGRARPPGAEEFQSDLAKSFPSGHASAGIYLYLATGLVLLHLGRANRVRWLALLGAALILVGPMIGLTRLVLGVHWPSDILAGWAIASSVVLASALILWAALDRGWVRPTITHELSGAGAAGPAPEEPPLA